MKFKVNGYTLTQKNISGFKIVVTDEKVDFIAKRRIDEYSRSGFIGFCSREDVVNNNRLVKYITKKILMKLIVMIVQKKYTIFNEDYIFIVHDQDICKVTEIENFVRSIGYEPIVLFKEADSGDTIIRKIEKYTSKSNYAIVLYTKCD